MGKTMEEELKKQKMKHCREQHQEKIETKVDTIETTEEKQETIESKEKTKDTLERRTIWKWCGLFGGYQAAKISARILRLRPRSYIINFIGGCWTEIVFNWAEI